MSETVVDPALPIAPCNLAVECAVGIANYCLTRFPTDMPPHPMLDVPWFAEKVQKCIEEAVQIGRELERELEEAKKEIADKDRELQARREILDGITALVGEHSCWMRAHEEIKQALKDLATFRKAYDHVDSVLNQVKAERDQLRGKIARLNLLLIRKNEALGVFASEAMWVRWTYTAEGCSEPVIQWNGADVYANPAAFARREMEADSPTD